ncbi:hypothetical protein POM88_017599 [Heracleum sosnowskyi]|uniref:GAG-pre-integrase domain-containing protein n=1 Tax=Heracleum sosnowskyi TaxID=360622 RepID=A0AAD8IPR2_9APIA|nr:hypothetical protein POM88_017599 [Heracleum sosnowskyi]
MVLREELQLKVGQREDPRVEAAAFVSRNQGEQRSQMRVTRTFGDEFQTCSHCKRQGHDKTRCFELIGYPEHWKNRGAKLGRGRGRGDGGRGFRGAMSNSIQGRAGVISNEESTSGNIVQLPSLTQGQLDRLMSLLGTGDTSTSIHDALSGKKFSSVYLSNWILDSGSSHHVYCDLKKFHNVRNAGENEDPVRRTLIGLGDHKDGVYYLRNTHDARIMMAKKRTRGLWHRRLRHPSDRNLSYLSKVCNFDSNNNDDDVECCDACHCAKQTRKEPEIMDSPGGQSNEEIESDINGADLITENVNSQDNIEDDSITQEISEDSRPQRNRKPPGHLKDYVCGKVTMPSNECQTQKFFIGKAYPLVHYVSYNNFSSAHKSYLSAINSHREPKMSEGTST